MSSSPRQVCVVCQSNILRPDGLFEFPGGLNLCGTCSRSLGAVSMHPPELAAVWAARRARRFERDRWRRRIAKLVQAHETLERLNKRLEALSDGSV